MHAKKDVDKNIQAVNKKTTAGATGVAKFAQGTLIEMIQKGSVTKLVDRIV